MSTVIWPGTRDLRSGASTIDRRVTRIPILLGFLGGTLAMIGAWLPWLSFFAGLQALSGLSGFSGWAIAGLGAIAVAGAVIGLLLGDAVGRWITGLAGFGVLALGVWAGVNLLRTAQDLAHDPLLLSSLEPGLAVALLGGGLAFTTLFVPARTAPAERTPAPPTRHLSALSSPNALLLLLAGALVLAGAVHVLLAPEHARADPLLGVGFVGAGLAQLALGALVALRRQVDVLALAVGVNLVLVATYVLAVTVGLPMEGHGSSDAQHGPLGHVEQIDGVGALTVMVELVAVGLALPLIRRAARA